MARFDIIVKVEAEHMPDVRDLADAIVRGIRMAHRQRRHLGCRVEAGVSVASADEDWDRLPRHVVENLRTWVGHSVAMLEEQLATDASVLGTLGEMRELASAVGADPAVR